MMQVHVSIDGHQVEAEEGTTLSDLANDSGHFVPTLCHLRGAPCLGTCRVCTVLIDGSPALSCATAVTEGMTVVTDTPELVDMRRSLVELLFVEGNHNCPSCEKSGRCELQVAAYRLEVTSARHPYRFPVRHPDHAAQNIWLERDRCIFCQRCVEFIRDEATGRKIFSIHGRGHKARIEIDVQLADRMAPELVTRAAAVCPVGCILEKGIGYDQPMGQRRFDAAKAKDFPLTREFT